jgi:cyanophycin synthetase
MDLGGGICEVNAQPQLGSVTSIHNYSEVLNGLVNESGRVPIIIIIVIGAGQNFCKNISSYFEKRGVHVGLYQERNMFVSKKLISDQVENFYSAGVSLIRDKALGAVIMQLSDLSILNKGLPFDRFDSLLLIDDKSSPVDAQLKEVIDMLLPACDSAVYIASDLNIDFYNEGNINADIIREPSSKINSESFISSLCDNSMTKHTRA